MNTSVTLAPSTYRSAGIFSILGAVFMLIGAGFQGASGTDLWAALANGHMGEYLEAIDSVRTILIANYSLWIIGVFFLGIAGSLLSEIAVEKLALSKVALNSFRVAVPMAIIAFLCMLVLVVLIAPGKIGESVLIAEAIGWVGARADDIATALIIGVAPFCLSLAGKGDWLPKWLVILGYVAGIAALLTFISLYMPQSYAIGFLIIPVGLAWMLATGIVLIRKK